jgi:hypothetical protein
MLDRLLAAVQVIINYFIFISLFFFSIDDISLYSMCCSLSVSFNMMLSHFYLLSLFILSFIGNMKHIVVHPLVAVHVSAVRNSTHAHPLVVVLSLCFVCIFFYV